MEKLRHKLSITNKGFSLFEIVAALFILSTSIIVLYNLILSQKEDRELFQKKT